jgi:imidazolonepropionase-like amidohydrolase
MRLYRKILPILVATALWSVSGCESKETGRPDADSRQDGKADDLTGGEQSQPAGLVVLDHVTVVDANGVKPDQAVLILDDKIQDVRAGGGSWPADAKVIDGTGRFVVPGLVDSHVHLTYSGATVWVGDPIEANLRASLYHGVTAVVDVGASPSIFALRQAIAAGKVLGPALRATGPFLTEVGSHPCERSPFYDCVFVNSTNAKQQAQALIAKGADALKAALADTSPTPWPAPRLDVAALAQVTTLTVPVVAHVNSSMDVEDAIGAGVSVLAHPAFVETASAAAVQASLKANGVHTTLGAFASGPELVDGVLDLEDPQLILAPGVKANWKAIHDDPTLLLDGWLAATRKWTDNAKASLTAMRTAGTKLVPGSDAGYLFVPHGLGLQRELRRLAAMGWPPLELLRRATLDARQLIGLPGGTVAKGEVADLLLLTEDPSKKVDALSAIHTVVLRGQLHPRASLLTLDLQPTPGGQDETCLGPDDCGTGLACDRLSHICRTACPTPYAPVNSCGANAWCMPLDALPGTITGVCRPDAGCALYAPSSCEPSFYKLTCHPFDTDTNGCLLTGNQPEGAACAYTSEGSSCQVGLYCSPIDAKCYRLCDPNGGGNSCTPPTTCVQQQAASGVGWFGLCL